MPAFQQTFDIRVSTLSGIQFLHIGSSSNKLSGLIANGSESYIVGAIYHNNRFYLAIYPTYNSSTSLPSSERGNRLNSFFRTSSRRKGFVGIDVPGKVRHTFAGRSNDNAFVNLPSPLNTVRGYRWIVRDSEDIEEFASLVDGDTGTLTMTVNIDDEFVPLEIDTEYVDIGDRATIEIPYARSSSGTIYGSSYSLSAVEGSSFLSGLSFSTRSPNFSDSNLISGTVSNSVQDGDVSILEYKIDLGSDTFMSTYFTIIAREADTEPSLPTLSNRTGTVNVRITTITLPTSSSGNSPLTYSATGLPNGLSFNNSSRQITGIPTTAGTFTVTYTVTDNDGDVDSETFSFIISSGDTTPSLPNVSNRSATVDQSISTITLPTASSGNAPLTYTATNLPSGLSFNGNNRQITGTPNTVQTRIVTYTVTDNDGDTDFVTFTFTINEGDTEPVLPLLSNRTGTRNSDIGTITLPTANGGNAPLTYTVSNLPAGLSFNGNNRQITGTPTTAQTRTVTYAVRDSDGDTDSVTFTFTINEITLSLPLIANVTITVGINISFVLPEVSNGQPPFTYSLTNLSTYGLSFNASTRTVSGSANDTFNVVVEYRATEVNAPRRSASSSFRIIAEEPDTVPIFSANVDALIERTINTNINIVLPDATGGNGDLVYSVTGLPSGLAFTASTRTISGSTTNIGDSTITYRVTDEDSDFDEQTFTLRMVTDDLDPIFGTIVTQYTGIRMREFRVVLSAAGGGNPPLTYGASPLPPGLMFTASSRIISGTPTAVGTTNVIYTVSDQDGDTDTVSISITINELDITPTFDGVEINDVVATVNTEVNVTLPEAQSGNIPITYGLAGDLPSGLSFDPTTRRITGTPDTVNEDTNGVRLRYSAIDLDGDIASAIVSIIITRVNTAPVFGSFPNDPDYMGFVTIPFSEILQSSTGGEGNIIYSIDDLDKVTDVKILNGGRGYTTAPTVTFSAPPFGGTLATATSTISNGVVTGITITEMGAGYIEPPTITISDAPAGEITATAVAVGAIPPGLSFNPQLRLLSGTPLAEGTYEFTYRVADSDQDTSLSDADDELIRIRIDLAPNDPPNINILSDNIERGRLINRHEVVYINASGTTDPDNDILLYQWEQVPFRNTITINDGDGNTDDIDVRDIVRRLVGNNNWTVPNIIGSIDSITVTNSGSGYTNGNSILVRVSDPPSGGTRATARASLGVVSIRVDLGGTSYQQPPTITISGGGGTGAEANAIINSGGMVTGFIVTNSGSGYTSRPTVSFTSHSTGGSGASATVSLGVVSISIDNRGSGYELTSTITISGGGGSGATATATTVGAVELLNSTSSIASFISPLRTGIPMVFRLNVMDRDIAGAIRHPNTSDIIVLITTSNEPQGHWYNRKSVSAENYNLGLLQHGTIEGTNNLINQLIGTDLGVMMGTPTPTLTLPDTRELSPGNQGVWFYDDDNNLIVLDTGSVFRLILSVDGPATKGSLRTLGYGANQLAPYNHRHISNGPATGDINLRGNISSGYPNINAQVTQFGNTLGGAMSSGTPSLSASLSPIYGRGFVYSGLVMDELQLNQLLIQPILSDERAGVWTGNDKMIYIETDTNEWYQARDGSWKKIIYVDPDDGIPGLRTLNNGEGSGAFHGHTH